MTVVESLERVVAATKAQISGMEQAMHEKVSVAQIQDLSTALATLRTKLTSVEQVMRSGQDRMNQVEDTLSNQGTQVSAFRSALQSGGLFGGSGTLTKTAFEFTAQKFQSGDKRKCSHAPTTPLIEES